MRTSHFYMFPIPLLAFCIFAGTAHGQMIYWLDGSGLHRASIDGSIQELVRSRLTDHPRDAVLDPASGIVYWRGMTIFSSHIDGQLPVVPIAWSGATGRIGFDRSTDRVYWDQTSAGLSRVWSEKSDGTDTQELDVTGIGAINFMTIDSAGQFLYWIEPATNWIRRVSLDGGAAENFAQPAVGWASNLRVDADGTYVYWLNLGARWIQRAAMDTGVVEDLVPIIPATPGTLEVDSDRSRLLWINNYVLYQANLDGSSPETLSLAPLSLRPYSKVLIDPVREWVLDINDTAKDVIRMDFDGLQRKTIISPFDPIEFAIDSVNRKIYWYSRISVSQFSSHPVDRSAFDGSSQERLGNAFSFSGYAHFVPLHFVLDPSRQRISWTGRNAGDVIANFVVSTSNLNAVGFYPAIYPWLVEGVQFDAITYDPQHDILYWTYVKYVNYQAHESGIMQSIAPSEPAEPVVTDISPVDLRFESGAGKLYWTDSTGYIMRANADGSGTEQVLPATNPGALAIHSGGEQMYWTALGGLWTAGLDGSDSRLLIPGIAGTLQFDDQIVCDSNGDSRLDLLDIAALTRCYAPDSATYVDASCALLEIDVPDGRIDAYEIKWATASMTGP